MDQIGAKLSQIVTLREATTDAQTSAKAKVADERAQLPALIAFMLAYVAYVKGTFGNTPDVLADFGLVPKKAPRQPTPEQKAAAKAKREATRKARGTVGPVKKLSIVGNVIGVKVTPITAPEVPASPQPAADSASTPTAALAPTGGSGPVGGASPAPHS